MDRRSKIIVSVVSIFLVLLALIGITYAYFLTRIEGNTNDTSVSITTANLRIVYADASPNIEATNIQPSKTEFYTKTFTVTNEGNETIDYEVYLENVINDFVNYDDLLMFITCESNIAGNTCNGFGEGSVSNNIPIFGNSTYPTVNSKLIENTIEPAGDGVAKEIHTYKLYLMFYDDDSDQSDDMNRIIQGKIQIYDPKDVIAITGEVTNYTTGDYVELHSDVKTSEIKQEVVDGITKYTYKFYGVKPEETTHTIYIKNRGNNGTITTIGSKTINVTKGPEQSINSDASSIVIDDNSTTAVVNITISASKDSITLLGKDLNPYEKDTLAYEIYKNRAQVQKYTKNGDTYTENGTELNKNIKTLTTVTGIADGTVLSDNGLFRTEDDYGTSYIYRGSILNNYVSFAGFTWRIVRINGNGSVRLILDGTLDKTCVEYEDDDETCKTYAANATTFNGIYDNAALGYTYGQIGITEGSEEKTAYDLTHEYIGDKTNTSDKTGQSNTKQQVDSFYASYLDTYSNYISDSLFCGDKSLASNGLGGVEEQLGYGENNAYYAAAERLWETSLIIPTLKCVADNTTLTEEQKGYSRYTVNGNDINGIKTNNDLIYPIALLSADELVMSGAFKEKTNQQFYLYNSNTVTTNWYTMTPVKTIDKTYYMFSNNQIDNSLGTITPTFPLAGIRPVINLSYDIALYDEGNGTELDPYKVRLAS